MILGDDSSAWTNFFDARKMTVTRLLKDPSRHLVFILVVVLFAVFTRLGRLDDPLFFDELYHVLAGTSWARDGSFTLYEGAYERAPEFTKMVGWIFVGLGDVNVFAARIPSVIFGVMLVVVASLWTRIAAGPLAGWIVASLLVCWPSGIYLSQIVRFYAIHGVLFFLAAIAFYELFMPARSALWRLVLLVVAAVLFWTSLLFQDSSLVGLLGVFVWVFYFYAVPQIWRLSPGNRVLFTVSAVGLSLVVALVFQDVLVGLWNEYRATPWDKDPTAYHRALRNLYPSLWPMTPVFALIALASSPRPASFCLAISAVGIFVHSFAGVQNIRHIYYVSPFLFAIWAMGLQVVARPLFRTVWVSTDSAFGAQLGQILRYLIMGCGAAFVIAANTVFVDTLKGLRSGIIPEPAIQGDYVAARDVIEGYREAGAIVVVTDDLNAVKYFDGFDVNFSRNWLPPMNETEFARDPRTGRPMISELSSLSQIVQAYPTGVFVTPNVWWSIWPAYNNITVFLEVFNQPNVRWTLVDVGTTSVLAWTSDIVETGTVQATRALIEREQQN
ncbi:MAG: hypothetical protein AAFQ64_16945 [Pseudomonadota bacterium]